MHRDPRRPGFARRTSLAYLPTLSIAVSLVAAMLCRRLDNRVRPSDLADWLDRGDIDTVRTLLATVTGVMISTLALVLTLTIITLQLASSQFGPRLIRTFMRSGITRWTISVFAATFSFSLTTLAAVDGTSEFVPHVGTSITLILSIVSLAMLIFYVHDVATSIQVTAVLSTIAKNLHRHAVQYRKELDAANPGLDPVALDQEFVQRSAGLESDAAPIYAIKAGRLQFVQHHRLVHAAHDAGAVILIAYRPGDFVLSGTKIAAVSPASALTPELSSTIRSALVFGGNRTQIQDVEYALDQLVEIGLRALSPAINDTYTGLACVDWLTEALRELATLPVERCLYTDQDGVVRVAQRPLKFSGLINTTYDKLRQAGSNNPAVLIRLAESLASVFEVVTQPEHRATLLSQRDAIVETAESAGFVTKDHDDLRRRLLPLASLVN